MPNITRLGRQPSPPSGSKALKHSAHDRILPTCQRRPLRHRDVKSLVPVEQSGCLRRVRRGLLKAGARGLCESRPRTKLREPPPLTPVTGALPFPAWSWPSPLARRVGSGGQSLRTARPMGRGGGSCESAVGLVGITQLPTAIRERRLYRLVLRSQPEQPPRTQPRVPLTAPGKVGPRSWRRCVGDTTFPTDGAEIGQRGRHRSGGMALVARPSEGQTSRLEGRGWVLASNSTMPGAPFLFYPDQKCVLVYPSWVGCSGVRETEGAGS